MSAASNQSEPGQAPSTSKQGCTLTATDDEVVFLDAEGVERARFGGVVLADHPAERAGVETATHDDEDLLITRHQIAYQPSIRLEMRYAIVDGMLRVTTEVAGAPANESIPLKVYRELVQGGDVARSFPVNRWTRNAGGGIAFQVPVGRVVKSVSPEGAVGWEATAGSGPFDVETEAFGCELRPTPTGGHRAEYWFSPTDVPVQALTTALAGIEVGVDVFTEDPFNLTLESRAALAATIELFSRSSSREVTLSWEIRDFEGSIVAAESRGLQVSAGVTETRINTDPVGRGIYFLEASVCSADGSRIALARTNLAVMEPQECASHPTIFGLAAFRFRGGRAKQISEDQWVALSRQLGATRKRQVPEHTVEEFAKAGWQGLHQPPINLHTTYRTTPDGPIDARLQREGHEKHLALLRKFGCRYVEYGNELNAMDATDPAGGSVYARDYVIPLDEYLKEQGSASEVCTAGTQGPSLGFLEAFAAAGGWSHTGAIAHHPGRGNFAPDWAPEPDAWTNGTTGTYWNFLGGLRAMRRLVERLDDQYGTQHELLLTEVYAATYPNSWWEDTYRTSAENTILQMALCLAEGVDEVYWYCTNDGIWQDLEAAAPPGIDHMVAREYHFGLLNLDCSLKPSALAFATGAKHLADARFQGWIDFPDDPDTRGLLFETPRGELQMLWNRADGYVLNANHADEMFVADDGTQRWDEPEPWIDPWPTKTPVQRLAEHAFVTELNCLGQAKQIEARDGQVELSLDGAPRMYYGLATPPTRTSQP